MGLLFLPHSTCSHSNHPPNTHTHARSTPTLYVLSSSRASHAWKCLRLLLAWYCDLGIFFKSFFHYKPNGSWSTDRGSASVLAVTVALLPRMDGRLRPSHWAWSLLAVVLMAGGVASSGATVSGECGPSPRGAGVRGVGGPAHSARDTCDRWSGLSGASGRSRAPQVQWGRAEGGASPQSEVLEWGAHTGRAVSPRTRAGLAPLGR